MAEISTDYDNAIIFADPQALSTHARNLHTHSSDVAKSIKRLTDTIFNLKLGWAGKTQTEVNDFVTRWNDLMTQLFGTDADPTSGALNAMAMGTQAACDAFDGAEEVLVTMFNKFTAATAGSGSSDTTPSAPLDNTQTAITETGR
ncbi:WXG100 family type VII secretion target [Streptomyces prunicolor]|uniref:WXG100 family type VII secretion target n=1 Tax=Streptomyces prunicolor TaxID=67348 RepID=UPI00340494C9